MKCKIFTGKDGYLVQGIASTPVKIEDAINEWFKQFGRNPEQYYSFKFLQSQSSSANEGNHITITIFY